MTGSKYEDTTPTTWDWLESVGFVREFATYRLSGFIVDRDAMLWREAGPTAVTKVATRGRVRMAAELFGIDLKEPAE